MIIDNRNKKISKKKSEIANVWTDAKNKYGVKGKDKKKPKEPFRIRFWRFCKRWLIRLFHTVFFLVFTYVFVLSCISVLPTGLSYMLASTGFTLGNTAEVLLMQLIGLFIVAWIFVISLFVVRKALKLYIRNMKKTLSQEFIDKYKNELFDGDASKGNKTVKSDDENN